MIEHMTQFTNFGSWILALSPILIVLILMVFMGWGGAKAGVISWFLSILVAVAFFGGTVTTVASGTMKGLWETVFIFVIIWGAVAIYGVCDGMEAFPVITNTFNKATKGDKLLQILIVGMVFPAWMQGVLGFGTPVAVTAPLLLGLGFDPLLSVVIPAIGHSWTITFGSLGSSYWTLQRFTGLEEVPLAYWSAIFFIPMTIMFFFFGTYWYSKRIFGDPWREVKRGWFAWSSLGVICSVVLFITAATIFPSIGGFIAGFAGLFWGALIPYMPFYKLEVTGITDISVATKEGGKPLTFHQAFLPYYVVIVVVFAVYLSPLGNQFFGWTNLRRLMEQPHWRWGPAWPEIVSRIDFVNPASAKYSDLRVLTMPGTVIFASLILAIILYKIMGILKPGVFRVTGQKLAKAAVPATLTLTTLSMMAVMLMEHGMTTVLAIGVANSTGGLYPFFSNFIGQLGAFMTGSNTASNVMFGAFQRDTALVLGLSPYIMAGLQTVGGAIGNIHCPMNVVLGCATVDIVGREGEVIAQTMVVGLIVGALIGIFGLILMAMYPSAGMALGLL